MAKVFLTSATLPDNKHGRLELGYLQDSIQRSCIDAHQLTKDPKTADLILFAERERAAGPRLEQVREHPLFHTYHKKCYVINPRYKGIPYLPGVYASIPHKWYDRSRLRSSHYLEVRENLLFRDQGVVPDDGHLYSFRGKIGTASIRQHIANLSHSRGLVQDTTDIGITPMMKMHGIDSEIRAYMQRYTELIQRSKFVLCPRGAGPSSLRLFETMLMGRAPVIISDQWVPPEGPSWGTFSVRIAESKIHQIPMILEEYEDQAVEMGRNARAAWENWFSPEVTFHRIVEWCIQIQGTKPSFDDRLSRLRTITSRIPPLSTLESLFQWSKHKSRAIKFSILLSRCGDDAIKNETH